MQAAISVSLKVGEDHYNVELAIPSGTPTNDNPYTFSVKDKSQANMLEVAIGGKGNYFVNVAPPKSLMPAAIEQLGLNISEGHYDKTKGQFTTGTDTDTDTDSGSDTDTDTGTDTDTTPPNPAPNRRSKK